MIGPAPWARTAAPHVRAKANRRNLTAWQRYTSEMSAGIRTALFNAPVGETIQALLAGQLDLITSLPIDAAQRVHEASLEAPEAGGPP